MVEFSRRGFVSATTTSMAGIPSLVIAKEGHGRQEKLDSISPEDHGALADGLFDCTNAFEAAIEESLIDRRIAGRQRNRQIRLSSGVYRVTRPLIFRGQDIALIGAGAQSSSILIDHDGEGIVYTGGGDSAFIGITVLASQNRRRGGGASAGFRSDPGKPTSNGPRSSIRLVLSDFHVHGHPGPGIQLINPEAARLENVTANNNGSGCHIWGRDMANILNLLDFCRFRDNGGPGLLLENMTASIISRVECLNNKSPNQMIIIGSYNHIIQPDCEGFAYIAEGRCGLVIRGVANRLVGGVYYKLNTAISVEGADDTVIEYPKIDGSKDKLMDRGIFIDQYSKRTAVRASSFNLVKEPITDRGILSSIRFNGRDPLLKPSLDLIKKEVIGRVDLNLEEGNSFHLVAKGDLEFGEPSNMQPGDIITLIIDGNGVKIGFSPIYGKISTKIISANKDEAIVISFIAVDNTRLILKSNNILSEYSA